MPIIEPVTDSDPLSQGDILERVRLFSTERCWGIEGGEAVIKNDELCLVISRPCVIEHKNSVTVVPIKPLDRTIPKGDVTLDQAIGFLCDTRDGVDTPDVFYLGQMFGAPGLFGACLDSFHNINIPNDATERQEFLRSRRVARLSHEFRRDLHVRIFRAFASLGFDDLGWFSDEDLGWVIATAGQDIRKVESEIYEIENEKMRCEQSGGHLNANRTKQLKRARNSLESLEARGEEFKAEQKRRLT